MEQRTDAELLALYTQLEDTQKKALLVLDALKKEMEERGLHVEEDAAEGE